MIENRFHLMSGAFRSFKFAITFRAGMDRMKFDFMGLHLRMRNRFVASGTQLNISLAMYGVHLVIARRYVPFAEAEN